MRKKQLLAALKAAAIAAESAGRKHSEQYPRSTFCPRDPYLLGTLASIIAEVAKLPAQSVIDAMKCASVTDSEVADHRAAEAARDAAWEADRPAREARMAAYRAKHQQPPIV